uniref:TrmE-type G domain-containing protein n=1 Tax=Rhodnius prolixus TaxID=13249 RepID=T1HQF1_RHOPR
MKKSGQLFLINNVRNFLKREISTIFALSSGYGKCGVAVIRVSGPDAADVMKQLGSFKLLPEARKSVLRRIRDPSTNEVLDRGLVLWFPGRPGSFTGEDCCEFHVHGSIAVISAILNSLKRLPNLRLAEPGEFTKRAFYAGKLDLTAVEGLNDLINSETEFQRKQALNQLEGSLFHVYTEWKNILTKCVSNIEAYIDFGEDENIESEIFKNTHKVVKDLQYLIKKHLQDGRRGERLRSGVSMTILGAPNVGKSSLLNKLCKRPAAIVSPIAGTTRDLVTVDLDIGGYPVVLTDTAGIRADTSDLIEIEGVARAKKAASDADLILLVLDSAHFTDWLSKNSLNALLHICDNFTTYFTSDSSSTGEVRKIIMIFNKIDLIHATLLSTIKEVNDYFGTAILPVSCKTEDGLELLIEKVICNLNMLCGQPSVESPCYTQLRHRMCLTECEQFLNSYLNYENERDIDLGGHYLRLALYSLGKITGHVSTEEILNKIFADFCIGK